MLPVNKLHRSRLKFLFLILTFSILGCCLIIKAYQEAIDLYQTPSQLKKSPNYNKKNLRLGGVVSPGSLIRTDEGLKFDMHDQYTSVPVFFNGVPPALFKEGQAAVVLGIYDGKIFYAQQVLAKHDENYVIPKS